jgi:hypothetical protein
LIGLATVFHPTVFLSQADEFLDATRLAPIGNPFLIVPLLMLLTTLLVAYWVAGQASPPPHQKRWWSRLLIAAMHVAQPVERGWARYKTRFRTIEIPAAFQALRERWEERAGDVLDRNVLELWSESWVSREKLLERLVAMAAEHKWFLRIDPGWAPHDVRFYGDRWSKADVTTVTENHGGGRLLTRVSLQLEATLYQKALVFLFAYVFVLAWFVDRRSEFLVVPVLGFLIFRLWRAHRLLRRTVVAGLLQSAQDLGMTLVGAPELLRPPAAGASPSPEADAVSLPAREAS